MEPLDEKGANLAIQYGVTIFKALNQQTQNITDTMIATSALVQVLAEKFPDLAERYEHYRKEGEKDSPIAALGRSICAEFARIEQQLQKLLTSSN